MLVLPLREQNGAAIYLDIHHVEWRQKGGAWQYAVSALLGDGWYEGEVLIEAGDRVQLTFADEWLGGGEIRDLFRRVSRESLQQAVRELFAEQAEEIPFGRQPAWSRQPAARRSAAAA